MLIALNKPFNVLCQFTDRDSGSRRRTLADFVGIPDVYPAGRLDYDSEGLVLLTDDGTLAHRLTDPRWDTAKTYVVQVEGAPGGAQLSQLRKGIQLNDGPTLAARAREIEAPAWLWARDPPVRFRKTVPDAWIELTISEGRNRQVRRMTAAVGLPTLRLIRVRVGKFELGGLAPGELRIVDNGSKPIAAPLGNAMNTFKDHFSGHADSYREARPTYPDELFAWLAQQAPDNQLAWDAGCGNGQATVSLAQHFKRVIGTDPSANQIAEGAPRPNVEYRVEPAEQPTLADASVSAVCVAQALHWFDHARFYAEVKRVLKPGGLFAAWSYADCSTGEGPIDRVKDHLYVDLTGKYWPPERAYVDAGYQTLPFPFVEIAAPPFDMLARWNVDQFLAYLRTWSASQRYLKAKGADPVSMIEPDFRAAWGDPERVRDVRWKFFVRAGKA